MLETRSKLDRGGPLKSTMCTKLLICDRRNNDFARAVNQQSRTKLGKNTTLEGIFSTFFIHFHCHSARNYTFDTKLHLKNSPRSFPNVSVEMCRIILWRFQETRLLQIAFVGAAHWNAAAIVQDQEITFIFARGVGNGVVGDPMRSVHAMPIFTVCSLYGV